MCTATSLADLAVSFLRSWLRAWEEYGRRTPEDSGQVTVFKKKKTEKIVAVFIDQRENYEWALDGP
jgi:hypothetical protein